MLKITDPCYGDSGGPLAIWRAGHWQLVGVLEVFLYFFLRVCICIVGADWSTILKGRGIQLFFFLSLFFLIFLKRARDSIARQTKQVEMEAGAMWPLRR